MMVPMTLRILVADDHPVVRSGLAALLASVEGFEVVGQASDGEEALRETQLLKPDVVLMDVRMPGVDGVEATRRLRASVPQTAVLMLTMFDDDATVFTAMQAGARGYLLKDGDPDEVTTAIRAVASGQAVFGAGIASRMLEQIAAPRSEEGRAFPELSPREHEILELLAVGRRTQEIAADLHVSPKTVSNHMTSIFAKLQVTDRAGAIIRAREGGLGG